MAFFENRRNASHLSRSLRSLKATQPLGEGSTPLREAGPVLPRGNAAPGKWPHVAGNRFLFQ
jgi:hypothetical protein